MSSDIATPRILVCDDSRLERSPLVQVLQRSGYRVEEADDGEQALDILKGRHIDLMLLDLNMPRAGADGFDVLNYVHEHRRALPVILLSGMPPDEIQLKMHGLRKRELPPLLLKPVDPDQLIQILELKLSGALPSASEQVDQEQKDQHLQSN